MITYKDLILTCRDRKTRLEKPCHKCPYDRKECLTFRRKHGFDDPSFYSRIVLKLDEEVKADG